MGVSVQGSISDVKMHEAEFLLVEGNLYSL